MAIIIARRGIGASVGGDEISLASEATGDVMYFDGTDWVRLAIGAATESLQVNAGATAPEWAASGGGGVNPLTDGDILIERSFMDSSEAVNSLIDNWNFQELDLGNLINGATVLSDTAWVLRVKATFSNITNNADTDNVSCTIGISDTLDSRYFENDTASLGIDLENTGTTGTQMFFVVYDASVQDGFNRLFAPVDGTAYWFEMIRTSATNITYEIFSDEFITSLASGSDTINSTVDNLRYLAMSFHHGAASGKQTDVLFEDIRLKDGVSSW